MNNYIRQLWKEFFSCVKLNRYIKKSVRLIAATNQLLSSVFSRLLAIYSSILAETPVSRFNVSRYSLLVVRDCLYCFSIYLLIFYTRLLALCCSPHVSLLTTHLPAPTCDRFKIFALIFSPKYSSAPISNLEVLSRPSISTLI